MIERTNTNWIQTFTGRQFWPMSPRVEDVHLIDISTALSRKCRFGGHTLIFYNVENHSVLTYMLARAVTKNPDTLKLVLLHDACEAYMPDVASPIKQHLPEIVAMENRLTECIYDALVGRQPTQSEWDLIKQVDKVALAMEYKELMGIPKSKLDWGLPEIPEVFKEEARLVDCCRVEKNDHKGMALHTAMYNIDIGCDYEGE